MIGLCFVKFALRNLLVPYHFELFGVEFYRFVGFLARFHTALNGGGGATGAFEGFCPTKFASNAAKSSIA